jgi:hypothetical protein
MPVYRVLLGFAGNNQGWSETHQLRTTEVTPRNLRPLLTSWAQKRADFLGSPYVVNAFRASAYANDDGTRATRNSYFIKQQFSTSHASLTRGAEPGDVALIARGNSTGIGTQNTTFLGAPPDFAVDNGGVVSLGNANLGTDLTAYYDFLVANGFGWGLSGTPADNQIMSVTQNIDATVSFKFTAPVNLPTVHTTYYPIRVRSINNGHSPLNGAWTGTVIASDTIRTKEKLAFATDQVGGFVKIYQAVRSFVPYVQIDTELLVGNHKRGRPFGSSRGRAPTRVRA